MAEHRNLVVDLNNLSFVTRHNKLPSGGKKQPFAKEFIFIEVLKSILFHAQARKTNAVVICADSPRVWRRDIYADYKGNSSNEDIYHGDVIAAADMVSQFFRDYTSAYVLSYPRAEADDVIAVWCQECVGCENVILSTDRDFVQLINPTTEVYSPAQSEYRITDDAGFYLFVKCIRGDVNDNIRSAYPRVRTEKLKKAWDDDLEMLNLLEVVRPDGQKVGDVLEFNARLIDLTRQPDQLRQGIIDMIESYQPSTFRELSVLGYLAKYKLGDNNIFGGKTKLLSTVPIFRNK